MSLACGSGVRLYQRPFRRTIIISPLLDRSRKSAKRGRRARHSSNRVLMSPPWPNIAGPGIHQQGAYVASLSRLRVINTSWARHLPLRYLCRHGMACAKFKYTPFLVCNLFPLRARLVILHSACRAYAFGVRDSWVLLGVLTLVVRIRLD